MAKASDTQTRILEAAEALFARVGFAATTIKAIGAEAGVNPALLYYYFPDKHQLYQAVLDRRVGEFARHASARLPQGITPLEGIRRLVKAQAAFMQSSPHVPRLLARELADHEAKNTRSVIRELSTGVFRRLCELILSGQDDGTIRADLDPAFTAISIISQTAWFFVAQPVVSRVMGYEGALPAEEAAHFAEHAVRFAHSAVAVRPDRR